MPAFEGGAAKPVRLTTSGAQQGGAAQPVYVVRGAGPVVAGAALPVYEVTSGPVLAGPAIPIAPQAAGAVEGGAAVPIYVIDGYLGSAYAQQVFAADDDHLIAYWPLDDLSNPARNQEGTTGRDGTYSNVTLGQPGLDGRPAASFNGATSFVNIYSTSLNGAWNGSEGSAAVWCKVSGAGVWADGIVRRPIRITGPAGNVMLLRKQAAADSLGFLYQAGGGSGRSLIKAGFSPTGWFHMALTWSKSANEVRWYVDGVQEGATLAASGTWSGALDSAATVIGALATTPSEVWSGLLAHAALWSVALPAAQIAALAVVP